MHKDTNTVLKHPLNSLEDLKEAAQGIQTLI